MKVQTSTCCSSLCGQILGARVGKQQIVLRPCEYCGEGFRPTDRGGTRQRFCSRICYFTSIGSVPNSEPELDRYAAKRARERGAEWELISRRVVFERDGWICQLCGDPVDPDLKWPDRRSASLDHKIPLGLGGAHKYENVQLAHLDCNSRRSHTGPASFMPADQAGF